MDSTFPSACRLLPESVFHFSMRSLAKSSCAACEDCSNCESRVLSWLTDEYDTGPWLAGCDSGWLEEATWALTARHSGKRDKHRKRESGCRFIRGRRKRKSAY